VLDATCNLDVIRAWWARCPRANIGLATGHPGPDVVDVDYKPDRQGRHSWERLRRAGLVRGELLIARTASGAGRHVYYEGTQQGNSTLARHGVDFRSKGGYVVAPPSMIDGNGYRFINASGRLMSRGAEVVWADLRDHLTDRVSVPRPELQRQRAGGSCEQLISWLTEQTEGNRNAGLYWVAARMGEQGATVGDWRALQDEAVRLGLDQREVLQTIESAKRAPDNRGERA